MNASVLDKERLIANLQLWAVQEEYDSIECGAGSAGCVANRLTEEDPETTVLLLEAGNPDTKPEIQIPDCLKLLGSEVDWGYFSEPEPYLNARKIFFCGKVLGAPVRLMACSMFEVILTIMTTGRSWETPGVTRTPISRNLSTPHAVPTHTTGLMGRSADHSLLRFLNDL